MTCRLASQQCSVSICANPLDMVSKKVLLTLSWEVLHSAYHLGNGAGKGLCKKVGARLQEKFSLATGRLVLSKTVTFFAQRCIVSAHQALAGET